MSTILKDFAKNTMNVGTKALAKSMGAPRRPRPKDIVQSITNAGKNMPMLMIEAMEISTLIGSAW